MGNQQRQGQWNKEESKVHHDNGEHKIFKIRQEVYKEAHSADSDAGS